MKRHTLTSDGQPRDGKRASRGARSKSSTIQRKRERAAKYASNGRRG